jgi:general secretion pathway protein M
MIRLTRREKLLAGGLVFFTGVWSLFTAGVKPALARIETLNRVISEKQQELEKLRAGSKEYIFLRDSLNNLHMKIASQNEIFELLPFLESLVEECGLTENIAIMKQQESPIDTNYSETIVEIRLENLSLNRLVDLLYKIESSQVLAGIKSLHIKKNATDKNSLDTVIEINNVNKQ